MQVGYYDKIGNVKQESRQELIKTGMFLVCRDILCQLCSHEAGLRTEQCLERAGGLWSDVRDPTTEGSKVAIKAQERKTANPNSA